MAAGTASWFVGSYSAWPSTTVTIDGTPYEITAASGGLYLYHTTAALNFMAQLKAHMDTELGGVNVVRLNASGKMYLSNSLGVFAITWTDTLARDFAGFTQGNLSAASNYTADARSPYLFMPGRTESPTDHVLGVEGNLVWDALGGVARDGTTSVRVLSSQRVSTLAFTFVDLARFWDSADEDRHFKGFWDNVLIRGRKFFHYRNISEDDASTSAVSWTTGLGPYSMNLETAGSKMPFQRSAGYETVDSKFDVSISAGITPEYTA